MRRLALLASYDNIMLKINAVIMLQKRGEPAMKSITIGMDLGDKKNVICALDEAGTKIEIGTVTNSKSAISSFIGKYPGATVVIEAGTHSPWISRLLESQGCRVLIGNPRKLRMIWDSQNKSDTRDAEMLARIGRFDPGLLSPLKHRGEKAQVDLALIKARETLVKSRASLVSFVRSMAKSFGQRIDSCSTASFHKSALKRLPDELKISLQPVIEQIESLTDKIKEYDRSIKTVSAVSYPETGLLQQVSGVGPLTALAYVVTLESTDRFSSSRQVGPYLGLTPKRDQSGDQDKQLRITKAGNSYLRKLLVGSAQYILGPFGPDCNLRRFGERLAERGGKNAKRRAAVAVARKLAVLLHRLWRTGDIYEPFHKAGQKSLAQAV
jgi:transposase